MADGPGDGEENEREPQGLPWGFRGRVRHWALAAVALVGLAVVVAAVLWAWVRDRREDGSSPPPVPGTPSTPGTPPVPGGTSAPSGGSPGAGGAPGSPSDGSGGGSCGDDGCSGCSAGQEACDDVVGSCTEAVSDACSSDPGCSGPSCGNDSGCSETTAYAPSAQPLTDLIAGIPPMFLQVRVGRSPSARLGVLAIRAYQRWISPRLSVRCRFTPSCSRYGLQAIEQYGLLAGSRLALARIRRCVVTVPRGSVDPVPGHCPARPAGA